MRSYAGFIIRYFISWMAAFILLKLLFIAINTPSVDLIMIAKAIWNGLVMDISAAAYLTSFITVLLIIQIITGLQLKPIYSVVQGLLIFLVVFIHAVDFRLYGYWGSRLDPSIMFFLKTPEVVFQTITFADYFFPVLWMLFLSFVIVKIFKRFTQWPLEIPFLRSISTVVFLFFLAIMIIPIRGGIGIAPLNPGMVYFSSKQFYNHAAMNLAWNMGYNLSNKPGGIPSLSEEKIKKARAFYNSLEIKKEKKFEKYVEGRPNILLIMLESFTSKLIGLEYEGRQVTPFLNSLRDSSVYFPEVYSSGERTDKGLVSILSGFPAARKLRVLSHADKVENLPNLLKTFKKAGYSTGFYYGGDLNFAGMRALITTAGSDRVISMDHFPESTYGAKWGVHDHILLDTLVRHLPSFNRPFFISTITLSNHEPFDLPVKPVFRGKNREIAFLNTANYTDQVIQQLFLELKKTGMWKDLFIVLIADHGHPLPGKSENDDPEKFRIPMWWTGGAINKYKKYNKVIAQHDVPALLLSQLGIDHREYIFSQNTISPTSRNYGFFSFREGYGWVTDSTVYIYNQVANKVILQSGITPNPSPENFQDYIYHSFIKR